MNAIISCSNTENTIYSKMVLYIDHVKIYPLLGVITNVCIRYRQRSMYAVLDPAKAGSMVGPTASQIV